MSKAKVGDLIRIVDAVENYPYKNGDIFEVFGTTDFGGDVLVEISGEVSPVYVDSTEYAIHRKAAEEDAEGTTTIKDVINPQHYKQGRVEVIDIIEDAVQGADPFEAVLQANIIKYTQRYRNKNGVEDLKKAQWYLDKLVAHLENK